MLPALEQAAALYRGHLLERLSPDEARPDLTVHSFAELYGRL